MKYKINTLVTRDFSALAAPTGNVYEAVAIISKRARQVAIHMKEDLDSKLSDFISDDTEELQDEEKAAKQEQAEITRLYEKLPKPTTIATEEFLEDRLMYRYPEEENTGA
jgi:DNA-directed RNA polymerase subunit K/omega